MTRFKKSLSLILCIVLTAAMALFTTGCNDNKTEENDSSLNATAESSISEENNGTAAPRSEVMILGEGSNHFPFVVTDGEGKETTFEIRTDKTIVGEALQELGLLEGEEGAYGLYVKTVNGITADFDTDKTYWAFYVNGEYATAGVDSTEITEGAAYSFKIEK